MRGRCPACGAPLAAGVHSAFATSLLRCPACGSAVTAAPRDPSAHDVAARHPRGGRLASPLLALFDRRRLALLRRAVPPPAALLDAGAGRGRFVAAARAAGYDARGIEPSERGVLAGREAYGVALERVEIAAADVAPRSLDAVTLWHVLEHLDEPAAALERIAGWLRPGGALLVGVPNIASVQARLAGRRWFHLDVGRHRVHFTPVGLETLLRRCGFAPVRTTHLLLEHNPVGMWLSLLPSRTPAYPFHALRGTAPFDARDAAISLAALPLLPLAALAEVVAGLALRGGTIAVLATRAR